MKNKHLLSCLHYKQYLYFKFAAVCVCLTWSCWEFVLDSPDLFLPGTFIRIFQWLMISKWFSANGSNASSCCNAGLSFLMLPRFLYQNIWLSQKLQLPIKEKFLLRLDAFRSAIFYMFMYINRVTCWILFIYYFFK